MAKIPVRGMNPALKKITEKMAKNNQVDDVIKNVRRTMAKTAESSKSVKEVIDDTVGLSVKRKANGRRDIKSAKESANIFMRSENKMMLEMNEDIAKNIETRSNLISGNRQRSQELRNKYNKKANNLEDAMRNAEINQKRQQLKNNSQDLSDRGSRLFERDLIKSSPDEMKLRMEQSKKNTQNTPKNNNIKKDQPVVNANNWVYKAAAAGVGGGMVLSMSNSRGQQPNSQLYGQGGY